MSEVTVLDLSGLASRQIAGSFLPKFENEMITAKDGHSKLVITLKWSGHLLMVSGPVGALFSKNSTDNEFTKTGAHILKAILASGPQNCTLDVFMEYLKTKRMTACFECMSSVAEVGEHGNRPIVDTVILTALTRDGKDMGLLEMVNLSNLFGLPLNEVWLCPSSSLPHIRTLSNARGCGYSSFKKNLEEIEGITRVLGPVYTHAHFVGECLEGVVVMEVNDDTDYFHIVREQYTLSEVDQTSVFNALKTLTEATPREVGYPPIPVSFKNKKKFTRGECKSLLQDGLIPGLECLASYSNSVILIRMEHITTGFVYVQVHILHDDVFRKVPGLLRGVVYGPFNETTEPSPSDESVCLPPPVTRIFKWKLWPYLKVTFGYRNLLQDLVGTRSKPIDPKDGKVKFLQEVKRFTEHSGWNLDVTNASQHIQRMRKFSIWIQTRSYLWDKLRQKKFHDILEEFDSLGDDIELEKEVNDDIVQCAIIVVNPQKETKLPKELVPGQQYDVKTLPKKPTEDFPVMVVGMVPSDDAPKGHHHMFAKSVSNKIFNCVVGSLPSSGIPQYDTVEDAVIYLKSIASSEIAKIKAEKEAVDAAMKNVNIVIAAAMPPGSGKSTLFTGLLEKIEPAVIIQSDKYDSPKIFNQKLKELLMTGFKWCKANPGKKYFVLYDKNVPNLEGLNALQRNVLKEWPAVTVRMFTQPLVELDMCVSRIMERKPMPGFPKTLRPKPEENLGEAEITTIVKDIFHDPSQKFQKECAIPMISTLEELVDALTLDSDGWIDLQEAQFNPDATPLPNYYALVPDPGASDLIKQLVNDTVPCVQDNMHVTILHRSSSFWGSHSQQFRTMMGTKFSVRVTHLVCDARATALKVVVTRDGQDFTRPDSRVLHVTLWCAEGTKPLYAGTDLMVNPDRVEQEMDVDLSEWKLEACL